MAVKWFNSLNTNPKCAANFGCLLPLLSVGMNHILAEGLRLASSGNHPVRLCRFWPWFYIVVLGIAFLNFRSFTFHILFGLLYPFSLWTFVSLFCLDFHFPFLFGLFFSIFFNFFLFLFYSISFQFLFIRSRSHFGFLPVFFLCLPFFSKQNISSGLARNGSLRSEALEFL